MNYIVLDLEWNQCPNGKEYENEQIPFEIIEIGAVKLNSELRIIDDFHEIITPQVYTSLHPITKSILSLEEEKLKGNRHFPEVIHSFLSWCGKDSLFCTWGSLDLYELQRNMDWYKVPEKLHYPLFYYDIQKIFSIVYEDRKTRRSLEFAIDFLKLEKNTVFHNAWDDAVYTAKIMQQLQISDINSNSSIDYYRTPANRKQEIKVTYATYSKYISKPFASKTEAMKDRVVISTCCYLCHSNTRKKIRWFSSGSRNYLCLAWCERHGWIKGKIRMRQNRDKSYYVIKTLKLVGDEEVYMIREKQEIQRLRRRLKRTFQKDPD